MRREGVLACKQGAGVGSYKTYILGRRLGQALLTHGLLEHLELGLSHRGCSRRDLLMANAVRNSAHPRCDRVPCTKCVQARMLARVRACMHASGEGGLPSGSV